MNRRSYRQLSVTLLPLSSAYLLVSHGSRDPRPQAAVEQLAELLKARIESLSRVQTPSSDSLRRGAQRNRTLRAVAVNPAIEPLVGTATLELAPLPLQEQIRQFGNRAASQGVKRLLVLPLFLLPGVHVMEDIPSEVALAQQALGENLTIELLPHLGAHPSLKHLLATQMAAFNADARILLSHGSRRAGASQPVEEIAAQLSALPAYWSVSPSLKERVEELVNAEHRQIAIVPYFLFAGGITDAIAQSLEQLAEQFPTVQLSLGNPIGASAELANLILDYFHPY